ncbi:hypothetical protein M569_02475 [Genlisea aurea]|uniref:Uncharacterized protein n=1 Tax=Genlisea aurea TaxID=192259 RepID=S8CXT8_9LAMI|nr:hypothetical protein M569_02475 [Genlisea aurea]
MESQSHHCVREIRPIFKLPYLFPDIKNLFSTRGYYFGQGTSTRLELMAATTHSPSPKNSLFAAMPSFNLERRIDDFRAKAAAFFPLNSSGRVNQVFDGKMKGLAESYETKDSKSDDIAGRNSLKKKKKKVLQLPGVAFLPGRRQIRVSEENYGVETTRICTAATVGSVEDDGCHRFSRTTHGLFITSGNADLSSNEGAIFRNRGIKLKQLSSCSDEEQSSRSNGENREPNSRNKSSSEMEALDVGKSHSGMRLIRVSSGFAR